MIYPGACNKCGGDLYWEDEEYPQYSGYKCFQGGHFQKEMTNMVEPEPQQVSQSEKPKRAFTRGKKFLAYQERRKAEKLVKARGKPDVVKLGNNSEYWQGYRQAVLDGYLNKL